LCLKFRQVGTRVGNTIRRRRDCAARPAYFHLRHNEHQAANRQTGGRNEGKKLTASYKEPNQGQHADEQYHTANHTVAGCPGEIPFEPAQFLL